MKIVTKIAGTVEIVTDRSDVRLSSEWTFWVYNAQNKCVATGWVCRNGTLSPTPDYEADEPDAGHVLLELERYWPEIKAKTEVGSLRR